MRGWKNIFHANGKQKKTGVAILISDKIVLKIKKSIRDKEEYYIMIKGSIQEEDKMIVNIYAPNIGAPQYIRQTLRHKWRRRWHPSILAWKIPWTEEPGRLQSMGSLRVRHD